MTTSPQQENETTEQYVLRLMEEAVALKGSDYVYGHIPADEDDQAGSCRYIVDGQPSCIVGHVLVAAGVEPAEVTRHEGGAAFSIVPHLTGWPQEVVDALDSAQKAQDGGLSWGEALGSFRRGLGIG